MDPKITEYLLAQFGIAGLVVVLLAIVLFKLSAEFAKLRTDLQQQVTRDLLSKRFAAYGQLWSKLRPLAIYTDEPLSAPLIAKLSDTLSDWYFSADGGLFLTVRARDFYFSLQDVLRVAASLEGWRCDSRPTQPRELFAKLVADLIAGNPSVRFRTDDLDHPESIDPLLWQALCGLVSKRMQSLAEARNPDLGDSVFCIAQQVSSVLRSNLAYELHSRLELRVPRP